HKTMKHLKLTLTLAVAFTLGLLAAKAEDKKLDPSKLPPASSQTGVTYAKDIKPIFDKSCIKCHGSEKQKSKLRLDSLSAAIKGGENGPDIIAGKSDKSPLVYFVAHVGDEDDFMPPPQEKSKVPPLTKEQVGLIRAWIDQGAK
ncbi:MAG TPA: c-type cytochrome domain-containing protein, partial [Verrucomicrobiae bacterium]|nr:c-type cytochrome domain-containing protein [Verrucomicrobiae bacterium]